MSKKKQNKIQANKKSSVNNISPAKEEIKTPVAAKSVPSYIVGSIYFLAMSAFLYFALYLNNYEYTDIVSTILFLLYFVIVFVVSKKYNNTTKNSIWMSVKLLLIILGAAFFMNFFTSGLDYINKTNVQSQNVFDIKNYSEEIMKYEDTTIYADVTNNKLFFVNEKSELEQVSEFSLLEENNFDRNILDLTQTFFDLENNLRFAYVANNQENKVVFQLTVGEKRYLSLADASPFISLFKEKDSYDTPILKLDTMEIYQSYNPSLMLTFTNNSVQLSEYDTLTEITDSSYIDRVHTFLTNHFDSSYVLNENASGELLTERLYEDIKINLYSINCVSCQYRYGNSDICEVINGDTSYIFKLDIESILLKEGK